MSSKEVEDAVKFAIEDIQESLDTLEDDDYVAAIYAIVDWCTGSAVKRSEEVRNAGGRGS